MMKIDIPQLLLLYFLEGKTIERFSIIIHFSYSRYFWSCAR